MNRSAEILDILRDGLTGLVEKQAGRPFTFQRVFNFEKNQATLYLQASNPAGGMGDIVGKIDLQKVPADNGCMTCRCFLTEIKTGETKQVYLRLKDYRRRDQECDKIYGFFTHMIEPCSGSNGNGAVKS